MQSISSATARSTGLRAAGGLIWGFRGHRPDGGLRAGIRSRPGTSIPPAGFAKEGEKRTRSESKRSGRSGAHRRARRWPGSRTMARRKPWRRLLRETTLAPSRSSLVGAAVGRSYDVERAASPTGPWTVVGRDISMALTNGTGNHGSVPRRLSSASARAYVLLPGDGENERSFGSFQCD